MKDYFLKYKYNILYFFVIFFLLFYFVPYQEKFYLKKDIKIFKNDFYWEMIFFFVIIFLTVLFWHIFKDKENKIKTLLFTLLNVTLYSLFFAFIFQSIIISIVLFTNRFIDRSQTQMIYKVEHYKANNYITIINENKSDTINNVLEEEFIKRLDDLREKGSLKSIIKSDTVHIKYEIGLFGIKYLNE